MLGIMMNSPHATKLAMLFGLLALAGIGVAFAG